MSDLTVDGISTWISGLPDTATVLSNGPTGDVGIAEQINGIVQLGLDFETVLGDANALKGSASDLASRLAVILAANGSLQSGSSFPVSPTPVDGQLFYRNDVKSVYIYDQATGQWIFAFINTQYANLDGTLPFTGPITIKSVTPGIRMIGQEANARDWTIRESGGRLFTLLNTGTEAVPVLTEDNFFVPTGGCIEFDGTVLPNGWLWADGAEYSRTTYARLFSVVGTAFGSGDGSTTFNVRDKRGRVSIGVDVATGRITSASVGGANAAVLGGVGGFQTHVLDTSQMPAHAHGISQIPKAGGGAAANVEQTTVTGRSDPSTDSTGGGAAHSNTQPWLACNFIVKT